MTSGKKRQIAVAAALGALLGALGPAPASAAGPMVIYDGNNGGLADGWQDWSWAEIEMQSPVANGISPIRITAGEWEALQLAHAAFDLSAGMSLEFYINGGLDGGQRVAIQLVNGEEQVGETFVVMPEMKTWGPVSIDLDELGAAGSTINIIRVICQQAQPCAPFYIDKMFIDAR